MRLPPPPNKDPIAGKDLATTPWQRWFNLIQGSVTGAALDPSGAVILAPSTAGRNLVQPTSGAVEGLVLKAILSPVSIIGSANWTYKGTGFAFGSTISEIGSDMEQTYAYAPVPDVGNLVISGTCTVLDTGSAHSDLFECLNGIGVGGMDLNPLISTNQQLETALVGAWCWNAYFGIGGNGAGIAWASGPAALGTGYVFLVDIAVSADKGSNRYDVTVRLRCSSLGIDHTQILTDAIVNTGGPSGYVAIAGNFQNIDIDSSPPGTQPNIFEISEIQSGPAPSAKAFEVRNTSNADTAYINWNGAASFSSLILGSTGGILKASSGIVGGYAAVTDLADVASATIFGRNTAGTGAPEVLTALPSAVQDNITRLGTVVSGVWNGLTILPTYGGTGIGTYSAGDLLYAPSTNLLATLPAAADGYVLTMSSGLPLWSAPAAGIADNPTALVGLVAVNGSATTYMRSDASPAIDVGISPTWTGTHTFSNTIVGSINGNAATVTTNANLTGPITSSGNATSIASKTGTGTTFVMSAGPTLTGVLNAGSGVFSSTLSASNLSGTNTGDQTITLTGDVTGTGTGSFVTAIGANKVSLAMMAQMATASFLGRNTASTGNVEVLSVATVKTLLNLTGTNSGDQTITLTGDVTGTGTGSFAATIGANKVTLAMMAQMATASFLGRNTASTGNVEVLSVATVKTLLNLTGTNSGDQTITLTGDVTGTGTGSFAAAIGANKVLDTMIRQSAGLSIVGRSANTTGNVADITGTDGQVLRVSGTALGFGAIVAAGIASDAVTTIKILNSNVTLAKIANIADQTILGNNTGGSAAPVALTAAQTKTVLSLNNVENTALSTWAGSANITTLGTIATGVWSGTAVAETKGGTNQTSYTLGDLLYASAANTLSKLAGNTTNVIQFLSQTGAGTVSAAPVWAAATGTGNVVLSASPTLTGTITAAIANFSGAVTVGGSADSSGTGLIVNGASAATRNLLIGQSAGVNRVILRLDTSNNFVISARNNTTGAAIDTPFSIALDSGGAVSTPRNVLVGSGTNNPQSETADITIGAGTASDVVASLTSIGHRTTNNAFAQWYAYHGTNFVGKMSWLRSNSSDTSSKFSIFTANAGTLTSQFSIDYDGTAVFTAGATFQAATDSTSTGTGAVIISGGLGVGKRITLDGASGKTLRLINAVANASVAVTLGSTGPTGSTAGSPQGWMRIDINGTDRYMPFW